MKTSTNSKHLPQDTEPHSEVEGRGGGRGKGEGRGRDKGEEKERRRREREKKGGKGRVRQWSPHRIQDPEDGDLAAHKSTSNSS